MAVTYSNIQQNHRGVYFEATGDGATTALTVPHNRSVHSNCTCTAQVVTAPSSAITENKSGSGGFKFPHTGTSVPVSSCSCTSTSVTVNTSAAVANGTKAYVVVMFNQESSSN